MLMSVLNWKTWKFQTFKSSLICDAKLLYKILLVALICSNKFVHSKLYRCRFLSTDSYTYSKPHPVNNRLGLNSLVACSSPVLASHQFQLSNAKKGKTKASRKRRPLLTNPDNFYPYVGRSWSPSPSPKADGRGSLLPPPHTFLTNLHWPHSFHQFPALKLTSGVDTSNFLFLDLFE
jgi:hypothetical protein